MARYVDVDKIFPNGVFYVNGENPMASLDELLNRINSLPEEKIYPILPGEWRINCDGYYPYCSNCGTEPKNGVMSNFCPECGAYMKGARNESHSI